MLRSPRFGLASIQVGITLLLCIGFKTNRPDIYRASDMRSFVLAAVLALTLSTTMHADARDKRDPSILRQAEASTLITGTIDITAAGNVVNYAIDMPEKLPKAVLDMIERAAPTWKFEPIVMPEKTIGRSNMSLLFLASQDEKGDYIVQLRGVSFANPDKQQNVSIDKKHFRYPAYPHTALDGMPVPGTVYLVLRYDREGRVIDADAEQVNLHVYGSEAQQAKWREALAKACLEAAVKWRMKLPPGSLREDEAYGIGRVPVSFTEEGVRLPGYGKWRAHLPGPRKVIPWAENTPLAENRPDTQVPGDIHSREARRLITPLGGG